MPEEHGPEHVHTGDAILDIRGDVGALILHTDAGYVGREIEVSPIGRDDQRVHTAIHERHVNGRAVFAGIYSDLAAGEYRIWVNRPGQADRVTSAGGQVSEVDWREG